MANDILHEELGLRARTDQLKVAREFVQSVVSRTAMDEKDARAVVLAVDEAVANAVQHGMDDDSQRITLRLDCDGQRLCVTIIDKGLQFDVAERVQGVSVDIKTHVAAGKRRGLGLFIMRKVMDEVSYAFRDGASNELKMVKYIKREIAESG